MKRTALGVALVALTGGQGCGGSEPPRSDCLARVWVAPTEPNDVRVMGSWDDWGAPGIEPERRDDGWRLMRLALPPGEYGYLFHDADGVRRDPAAPLSTYRGAQEVSLLTVPDCHAPSLSVQAVHREGADAVIEARFLASAARGAELDVDSIGGATLLEFDRASGQLLLRVSDLDTERVSLSLSARDVEGASADVDVVSWRVERDPRDAVIYQAMIDRFRGDDGAPLAPPSDPGARAGGSLSGVASALPELALLGVDTLWLSPVYTNPVEPRLGKDGRLYEGYHGYWPLDSRAVEPRIGGEAALETLVDAAHDDAIAVLLDVVPNHVYEDNPRFAEHPEWFGEPGCVCGTPSCPWAGNIQTCWFTDYLPDVDWRQAAAMDSAVDDTRWWMQRFELDGVRIDAVPMMPRAVSRKIAAQLRDMNDGTPPLLLGEVFTGPGAAQVHQLRYHLGPHGLDAVFDFPLMWALQEVIARGRGSFASVEAVLAVEEDVMAGSLLARILDNHDTPRFVSVAHGDAGGDAWEQPAAQPSDPEPYRRLMLGLTAIFTLPGMVVLYQGDEIGLAGAGDPDNRRVMPAEDTLLPIQREVRELTARLGQLRRCSAALRHGTRVPLLVGSERYAYLRDGEHPVVVVLSTAEGPQSLTLPADELPAGNWRDAFTGEPLDAALQMVPLSARILLRDDDPCAP